MTGVSKLLFGDAEPSDRLRYAAGAHRRPIVVWNVTPCCNLDCSHCYAAHSGRQRVLSTDEAKRAIDGLASYGVPVLLFSGGEQEKMIAENDHRQMLSLEFRREQLKRAASMFDNVVPLEIDVSSCRLPNGEEDWDAETPLVLKACGYFDAVFGSEPGYAPYFERAYPWAKYEMVDAARTSVPISATKVRAMKNEREIEAWIV